MIETTTALAKVIGDCGLHCFGSVVRTGDLRRFNREFGVSLNGYSLALADCIGNISLHFPGVLLDLRVDRGPSKPYKKIQLALDYLASDKIHPECFENAERFIDIATFQKGLTFRNMQAIQAADFAAWEMRKNVHREDEFFTAMNEEDGQREQGPMDYVLWLLKTGREKEVVFPPLDRQRKSFTALGNASEIIAGVWDYHTLRRQHEIRGGIWSVP